MLSYAKGRELGEKWLECVFGSSWEITSVIDKPYGWIFSYLPKGFDPDEDTIFDLTRLVVIRVTGDLRVIPSYPEDESLQAFEKTLPHDFFQFTPERHDGVKKYR